MNLDHDVFIKKTESIALNTKVEELLKERGQEEPTQIPFGYSALREKHKKQVNSGRDTLRQLMTSSVEQSRSRRKVFAPNAQPQAEARAKGELHFEGTPCKACGQKIRYTSNAKCISCSRKHWQLAKKNQFEGAAA